jgi:hypothetical protein
VIPGYANKMCGPGARVLADMGIPVPSVQPCGADHPEATSCLWCMPPAAVGLVVKCDTETATDGRPGDRG